MYPLSSDNIVALATHPGPAALALIRLSGTSLAKTFKTLSRKTPKKRLAIYSTIYHPVTGNVLDKAIIIFYKKPNSFTGEDMIEINCHGGEIVTNSIIRALLSFDVRMAQPGEFSMRSFLNGKIDLLQAESISELIHSNSQFSADISLKQMSGITSKTMFKIKDDVFEVLSIIENELNFLQEEITMTTKTQIKGKLLKIKKSLKNIIGASVYGKELMGGYRVILIGKPNAGKSSLFNTILGKNRAIVSDLRGTTRDTIESTFDLNGMPICLIDTAGLWKTNDKLDSLGVKQTITSLNKSNLCLILDEEDPGKLLYSKYTENFKGKHLLIKTKCDNADFSKNNNSDVILTSSINGGGINKLLTMISTLLTSNYLNIHSTNTIFVGARQRALIIKSERKINEVINQCTGDHTMDIIASSLYSFIAIIKELVGEITNEDVINKIFSKFCIGK